MANVTTIRYYGLTRVEVVSNSRTAKVTVVHTGCMGNSIQSIDSNLFRMYGVKTADLKLLSRTALAKGSPDYSYVATYHFDVLVWEFLQKAGKLALYKNSAEWQWELDNGHVQGSY